jgi:hypothetical protein
LRKCFHLKSDLFQITILSSTEKLLSLVNDMRLCSFEVPLYQLVMYLGYRSRHDPGNIFADNVLSVVA